MKRVAVSSFVSFLSRGVSAICLLLAIPIAIRHLGTAEFGVWSSLSAFAAMLAFFDFGIGIGLQNKVSELFTVSAFPEIARVTVASIAAMLLIALSVSALTSAVYIVHPSIFNCLGNDVWNQIVPPRLSALIIVSLALGIPFTAFTRVAIGIQAGWISSTSSSIGAIVTLLAIALASRLHATLTAFVAISLTLPILTQLITGVMLFRRIRPTMADVTQVQPAHGFQIIRAGSRFILPQIAGFIIGQYPIALLATRSTPANAALYAILTRLGSFFQLTQQTILTQLWPALSEAIASKDYIWFSKAQKHAQRFSLALAIVALLGGSLMFPGLVRALSRNAFDSSTNTAVFAFSAALASGCLLQSSAYIANAASLTFYQNVFSCFGMLFAIVIFPYTASRFGVIGICTSMLVLNACFGIPLLHRELSAFRRDCNRVG